MSAQISTSTDLTTPALTKKQRNNQKRHARRLRSAETFLRQHAAFLAMDIARANVIKELKAPSPALLTAFQELKQKLIDLNRSDEDEVVLVTLEACRILEMSETLDDEQATFLVDSLAVIEADHEADRALGERICEQIDVIQGYGKCLDWVLNPTRPSEASQAA